MVLSCPGSARDGAIHASIRSGTANHETGLLRRGTTVHLISDATWTFTILSGSVTRAARRSLRGGFFNLSTTSIPDTTSPITVYWPFEARSISEHDEELRVRGIVAVAAPGHADDAALERHAGELGLQVRVFRAASTVEVLASPVCAMKPSITRWNGTLL